MGWELIGGDPAPGSPDAVASAASALRTVSDLATEAHNNLVQQAGQAGITRWKGSAADTFRDDIHKLPTQLDDLTVSYREASGALVSFHYTLEQAQFDARAALAAAQQAIADRDAAKARMQAAQAEADALSSQHRSAQLKLAGLQTQQTVSIDPVHRTSLNSPIAATRSQLSRLDGDLGSARQNVSRHTQSMHDAQSRLDQAVRAADGIRSRITAAVDVAVRVLQQAERDGHLPNWWQQHLTETKQLLVEYGPVLIQSLKLCETLFSLAALVFPPGAAIFGAAALICGVGVLLLSAATYASSPGGLTPARWLDLGKDTLDVAVSATGLAGASKLASAAKFATASKWLGYSQEAEDVGEQTYRNGTKGLVVATTTHLLGHGTENALGAGLRKASAQAAKSEKVVSVLDAISRDVGRSKTTVLGVPLVSGMDSRATQSLLASGRDKFGHLAYGNQAANDPSIADNLMGKEEVADLQNKFAGAGQDKLFEKVEAFLLPEKPDAQPEIDIDLNPSRFGSTR